jgi:PiT family inorganic phosphate transporter
MATSNFALPVAHFSVGSIYGIGLANRTGNKKGVLTIILSWLLILSIAALPIARSFYLILQLF